MFLRLITSAALFLAIGPALAAGPAIGDSTQITVDKQQFALFETQVKADLDEGKRYKEITPENQTVVKNALERMEQRWQKAGPDGRLNQNDSVDMANDSEIVSAILKHAAADSRLVCSREIPMGSKIAVNVCRTIAQMKREQNGAQDQLREAQEQSLINPRAGH